MINSQSVDMQDSHFIWSFSFRREPRKCDDNLLGLLANCIANYMRTGEARSGANCAIGELGRAA